MENSQIPTTGETRKILFALPRLGINLFMGTIDFALLYLYESVYQLNPILVGISLMLGKFSVGISTFFFGWLSDHTNTKLGRRKPYLFIMSPILAITFVMLLLPGIFLGPSPEEFALFSWFATFNVLSQSCYALTAIYHSWTAEQFQVHERPKISQYQNLFNFIGLGVVILMGFLVLTDVKERLREDPTTIPANFVTMMIIFALLMIGLIYFVAFYMPVEKTPIYHTDYKTEFRQILNNRGFMSMVVLHSLSFIAWGLVNSIIIGYIDNVLMLKGVSLYVTAGSLFIIMIIVIDYWRKRIETKGKTSTLLLIFKIAMIFYPLSLLGLFPFSTNVLFGVLIAGIVAATEGGWYLFPYLIYADLAEDQEKKQGELKAGLFAGFPNLVLNIVQAFALFFTGWVLSLPKVENVPGNTFSLGYVLWGPICAVVFVAMYIFAKKNILLDFEWEKNNTGIDQKNEENG